MASVREIDQKNADPNLYQTRGTNRTEPATENSLEPILPGSLMWRDFGALPFHLMLPQAFTMQVAYPMVDLAIGVDKKYKSDPYGRAQDSTRLLWPIVYSRPEKAIAMGVQLKEMHRKIKGVNKDGKKYFALDPEAYSWVHVTGFDATLRSHEIFGKALNQEERAQAFTEWQKMGRLLGVADRYIFASQEEYWQHFNYIIEEKLVAGEVCKELLDPGFLLLIPRHPDARWMPNFLWNGLMRVAGKFQHALAVGTLPENAKRKLEIQQSRWDKILFSILVWTFRRTYPLLPERSRYIPLAWEAIQDSRLHPEAYALPSQ